jgi:hypothetical protein
MAMVVAINSFFSSSYLVRYTIKWDGDADSTLYVYGKLFIIFVYNFLFHELFSLF